MAQTPIPNLIHDPPSLPASPEHKRTRKIDPIANAIGKFSIIAHQMLPEVGL